MSTLVSEVVAGRELILTRGNVPAAAIIGIEKLERLRRIEEDIELFTVALVRMATDTGERVALVDLAARFGIDLHALATEDADDEEGRLHSSCDLVSRYGSMASLISIVRLEVGLLNLATEREKTTHPFGSWSEDLPHTARGSRRPLQARDGPARALYGRPD